MRSWTFTFGLAALAIVVAQSAAYAGWQDEASPYDVHRLERIDEARAQGLAEAQSGRDFTVIRGVLDRAAGPIPASALQGHWRCRTMKLGGMTPDVVYSWFNCRVTERAGGLFFEKDNGTQRFLGRLYPHESGGYVLLGAASVKGEPWHRYSGNEATAGAAATPDDTIGLLSATGPSSARIEFPYPVQESTFDVIELKR
jgi:hypothetical protein